MTKKKSFTSAICKIRVTREELHSYPCPLDIDALSDELIQKSVNAAEEECMHSLVATENQWKLYRYWGGFKKEQMETLFYGELEIALLANGAQYIEDINNKQKEIDSYEQQRNARILRRTRRSRNDC